MTRRAACPECERSEGPHYRGPCEHGQPRLPGRVGAVRDREHALPKFDLPRPDPTAFDLTAQQLDPSQPSLFGGSDE
jgi:hypothetical protein